MKRFVSRRFFGVFLACICAMLCFAGLAFAAEDAQKAKNAEAAETATNAEAAEKEAETVEVAHNPQPSEVVFTDGLGNEVTVNDPQRVVACMGSFADMWQLAGGTLVGASTDSFEQYGLEQDNLAELGDFSSLNLESILACEPDFAIMTCAKGGRGGTNSQVDMRQSLEDSGVTTAYFEVTTFEDYMNMFEVLCQITDRPDLFKKYGTDLQAEIDTIIKDNRLAEDTTVNAAILVTFSQGLRVQNSSSMTGAMLQDLGVRNIADQNPSLLRDFSLESLIEIDPDIIYVLPMGNNKEAAEAGLKAATTDNPAWATLTAVTNDKVIMLEPKYFMYKPNENWGIAYQILADSLKDK